MTATTLIGVYDADGGLLGEASYVWGKLRGTKHCGLCDITHSSVRRKPAWGRLVAELGRPLELLHLNEMPPDVAVVVAQAGAPVVLARHGDGSLSVLLGRKALDAARGSVDEFAAALREQLAD